jgi:TFIIF-interacting CTD phosphatase-like protein
MDCRRMNVILDLDNTIINALDDSDRKKLSGDFSNNFKHRDMIPFFRIYARPHLDKFLDYLFANFNVAIMTAAEKDYALFIIENFILTKPERKIEFIFFRYQVELSREIYGGVKDLRIIWDLFQVSGFTKQNTIILDDLDMVYETNPHNTLRIKGFFIVDEENGKVNYDMKDDDELLKIMSKLDYIRKVYHSNICNGINKAILDVGILPSKIIEDEQPELEEVKKQVEKEVKEQMLEEGNGDEATKQIQEEKQEEERKKAIEEKIEEEKEKAEQEIEQAKQA